jgi:N-acetylmuramoyl-L-alanine amidase
MTLLATIFLTLGLAVSPPAAPDPADVDLLARLLYAECRGESADGQRMVAQCVLDRLSEGTWGDTLREVIHSEGQFAAPAQDIDEPEVFERLVSVAEAALMGGRYDETRTILYFRRTSSRGDWYAPYIGKVGNHAYYGERRPTP